MKNAKSSIYQNLWVLHYTEDVTSKAFPHWYCKSINTSQATREIKSSSDFEKIRTIYQSMVEIGEACKSAGQKGEAAITAQIKSQAAENIPCGEELASVVSDKVYDINEWIEFVFVTPDISLEKERQWPVD